MLEVAGALERVAAKVRSFMPQFVDLQPDGSGAPQMLAMRDAFLAFPAPAEVLFIDGKGMAERRDCGTALDSNQIRPVATGNVTGKLRDRT